MNAAKHTPGPWTDDAGTVCADAGDYAIAVVIGDDDDGLSYAEANARLIAAAPELLEALQRLLPAYREAVKLWDSNHDDAFTVQAHNAIAKATGGAA